MQIILKLQEEFMDIFTILSLIGIKKPKEMTGESFPYIGDCFNRKHTTIMYSHQKVKSDIAIDRHLAQDINELTAQINEVLENKVTKERQNLAFCFGN